MEDKLKVREVKEDEQKFEVRNFQVRHNTNVRGAGRTLAKKGTTALCKERLSLSCKKQ